MHACNLHCSSTCGGTSKQTNSHCGVEPHRIPTNVTPKDKPISGWKGKTRIVYPCFFEKKKNGDFLSLLFGGKSPFFGEKAWILFFCPFKNRTILVFLLFSLFFPIIHAFFGKYQGGQTKVKFAQVQFGQTRAHRLATSSGLSLIPRLYYRV